MFKRIIGILGICKGVHGLSIALLILRLWKEEEREVIEEPISTFELAMKMQESLDATQTQCPL